MEEAIIDEGQTVDVHVTVITENLKQVQVQVRVKMEPKMPIRKIRSSGESLLFHLMAGERTLLKEYRQLSVKSLNRSHPHE
jgi:hypothetical protein